MLFEINEISEKLKPVHETWNIAELKLEKYILSSQEDGTTTLNYNVFNEELLIINNQVRTRDKKRADILALDRNGNAVIIELKKDKGSLGVETQALQYLADFSRYKGESFLEKFLSKDICMDRVLSFLGEVPIQNINENNRIILIARSFDTTLYSMGEWLASKNIGFRCISYRPIEILNRKFLSFSVTFDQSPESLYPIEFESKTRQPKVFWHNIGYSDDEWWDFLKKTNQISCSFDNAPGDQGEKILKNYLAGDKIVAYATGKGAVGWGIIKKDPLDTYRLIEPGSADDVKKEHRHRIKIDWQSTAKSVDDAIPTNYIRDEIGIYHPVSTSAGMDSSKAVTLLKKLDEKYLICDNKI